MKIREVQVQNLRNFGPDAPAVSFVDPDTNLVRPLTILVGANGSGKTTLLEMIEWMCWMLWRSQWVSTDGVRYEMLLHSMKETTRTRLVFGLPDPLVVIGSKELIQLDRMPDIHLSLGIGDRAFASSEIQLRIRDYPRNPERQGGLQYYPSYRRFKRQESTAISQPTFADPFVYRYRSSSSWSGSLPELWVWQNYLDLESQHAGHPNLLPFVETIQAILGNDQTIKIHRGEVWIERPKKVDRVRLHELPSGEQQILVLFGEIIRRLRPRSIIMIDELEISLHPALQRLVLHHLRRLAQQHDLQIIVTTHSMEIVAAADPSEIVNLDDMVFTESAARTAEPAQ